MRCKIRDCFSNCRSYLTLTSTVAMLGSGEGHRPGEIVRLRYGLAYSYVVKRGQAVEIQTPLVSLCVMVQIMHLFVIKH
jgi:hypothetical protein